MSTGEVDSATGRWAIQPRGSAVTRLAQHVELGLVGARADDDPAAARPVHRLEDQLVQVSSTQCRTSGSSSR